jgi:hypothetical protein
LAYELLSIQNRQQFRFAGLRSWFLETLMKTPTRPALFAIAVALALGLVLTNFGRADDKPKPKEPKKLSVMQRKLGFAQKVLEGLAVKDYKKLDAAADGLIDCVKDETWKINQTQQYLVYTNDFLRRVQGLKKAAKDKNLDAAALSYVDMTLTCVKCHQYLRDEGVRAVPDLTALAPKAK